MQTCRRNRPFHRKPEGQGTSRRKEYGALSIPKFTIREKSVKRNQ